MTVRNKIALKALRMLAIGTLLLTIASCATTLETAAGTRFKTYSDGQSLSLTTPDGVNLTLNDYTHSTSIAAAGEAIQKGSKPIVHLGMAAIFGGVVSDAIAAKQATDTVLSNNATRVASQQIAADGAVQLKQLDISAAEIAAEAAQ